MPRNKVLSGNDHYIVAIGASAGGLEAIHEFFDNMPLSGTLSFVIVQHLSPDYKSLLVELVSKHTNMQVLEAGNDMHVEKNCVYVIPNNKLLTIKNGKLKLNQKSLEKAPNTAIDTFLYSLAEDQGNKSIAVILSGTGTDGSRGIEAVQKAGGMVLVQDPLTAKFDGMPNAAMATGFVDFILSPELMPEEIFNYIHEQPEKIHIEGKPDETLLPEVLKLVEKNCGHDFVNYKTPTILRRIGRRMNQLGKKQFKDYLAILQQDPEECKILGKEFLIGVTKFFRDEQAFSILANEVLPAIISEKKNNDVIKIWVTACSSGEEAYTIAILVNEAIRKSGKPLELKIFATDIDIEAVEAASKGIYKNESVSEINKDLVLRYFVKHDEKHLSVLPKIRKQIVFAKHNILKDPPFIKNDLVTCRNMLIYMNQILQRRVLSTLQFSLNKGGYLFLGPSEIPSSIKENIDEVNSKWKIYRKVSNENSYNPDKFNTGYAIKGTVEKKYLPVQNNKTDFELVNDFKNILTEAYGFAAVYIDKHFEVKEAVGDFKKYLALPDKIGNLHILKMVNTELSVALNTAIRKCLKDNTKITLNKIRIRSKAEERFINLFVQPASGNKDYLIIVFGESNDAPLLKSIPEFTPQSSPESVSYITELEDELKETRINLQMAIESLETTNEELQSSNEELLSANEELQSSNEELQSLNEELHTLNTEHQLRIKELIELNDDLNNYFRSTEIGQIFIDGNLRIRKFNPAAVRLINLIETDIGRPIDHISTNIKDHDLLQNINEVLSNKTIYEKEVKLSNGTTSIMRILPYVKQDKKIDGAVISFIDITELKELDNIIKGVFNSSLNAIMAFKAERKNKEIADFRWIAANHAAEAFLNKNLKDVIGKAFTKEFPLATDLFEKLVKVVESGQPLHKQMLFNQNGSQVCFDIVANKMDDGLVITLTNIDEKRQAEEKFRKNYQELIKVKENYRKLNIELEEKVAERTQELSESEERFRLIANATNDAIWDWNLVTNELWWSESFYTRFGFERNDETANSNFWFKQIHPDEIQKVKDDIYNAINQSLKSWSHYYRFKKGDGSYAKIFDKGSVLTDAHGTPYRMIGAMMDISETEATEIKLKEKNEELQALIEEFKFVTDFMPQMVWATKPNGYHDFYNKGWYDYTGLTYEQTKDKGWSLILHPDDFDRTWKVWQHCLDTGDKYEIEYRMRRWDGEYRWFLARAIPLKDHEGKIVKWFGTCTDIHDQKMYNDILELKVQERTEELKKTNAELEASNSELLQFAFIASHDLKEPLRKIHLFSNLVKDKYLTENSNGASDYMNRIIKASTRMTRLINDLLSFTKLSIKGNFENVDFNEIIQDVLTDLELKIAETKAEIQISNLPKIDVIPWQMKQVMQNIISNSLKFAKDDQHPQIKISSTFINTCSLNAMEVNNGEFCKIIIKDNGIGFSNEYADKIFSIFQRLHTREKYEGTGIGLSISRKIIERHNGKIIAIGEENKGATFVIILPVKQNTEANALV